MNRAVWGCAKQLAQNIAAHFSERDEKCWIGFEWIVTSAIDVHLDVDNVCRWNPRMISKIDVDDYNIKTWKGIAHVIV